MQDVGWDHACSFENVQGPAVLLRVAIEFPGPTYT